MPHSSHATTDLLRSYREGILSKLYKENDDADHDDAMPITNIQSHANQIVHLLSQIE